MNRSAPLRPARRGFTILEVMLAVTILGVVFTAVYTIWSAALSCWKRGSEAMDKFQRQRVVLDTLSELTSSAVLFPSLQGLYMVIGQREQPGADSISFVTSSEVLLPPREAAVAGLRRVTISLQRDDQGNPYLALQNSPALTPADSTTEAELHVLSADVTGFAVRYRHPQDGDWRDTWEERDVMPAAIEYTIAFGGADGRTEPLLVTRAIDLPTAEGALLTMGDR